MPIDPMAAAETDFDMVTLGEVMVRLSPPGHDRLEFAPVLGGPCWWGRIQRGACTVAPWSSHRLGRRARGQSDRNDRGAGVDTSFAPMFAHDGIGRDARMGLYFLEEGAGPRASVSVYDRGYSATSQIQPGQIDWDGMFGESGVRWFHTGGIFTCLSDAAQHLPRRPWPRRKQQGRWFPTT